LLFNSLEYLVFLPIVFSVYWLFKSKLTVQNCIVLLSSYTFYAFWDWRFLGLIFINSAVDFFIAKSIYKTENEKSKKLYLQLSLVFNIGTLCFFKYFNFFSDSFISLFNTLGVNIDPFVISLILPLGISFYTFQTMSYTIDVYNEKLKPTNSLIEFLCFVSFFPQLVAGPIERAVNLLPQFSVKRRFQLLQAVDGCRQILWGFFKKVVIADNCAIIVDSIFTHYTSLSGFVLFLGALLFTIQVYADFSGYSDIAIGSARLLGFNLSQNFSTPYFSTSTSEVWRRWHISLSNWFGDYVYSPLTLKYRRFGVSSMIFVTLFTFTLIGLWHGASWVFVLFGFYQGVIIVVEYFSRGTRLRLKKGVNNNFYKFSGWLTTALLWITGLMLFRSQSVSDFLLYFKNMISSLSFDLYLNKIFVLKSDLQLLIIYIVFFFSIEWINRNYQHGLYRLPKQMIIRLTIYIALILLILQYFYGVTKFIYFQF